MDMQEGVFLAYGLQRRHAGPDGCGEANTVPKAPNKATQCQLEIASQTGQPTRNRRPEPRTSNAIANWIKASTPTWSPNDASLSAGVRGGLRYLFLLCFPSIVLNHLVGLMRG